MKGFLTLVVVMLISTVGAQSLLTSRSSHKKTDASKDSIIQLVELPLALPGMLVEGRDTLQFPSDTTQFPLKNFFAMLDSLKAGKDTVLTIVHLGDSHLQAGKYSGKMMRLLQNEFGNAGRGWVAPFKLNHTNEPDDYFIKSSIKQWVGGRIIQRKRKTSIGMGGIGVRSTSPSINLNLQITPKNGAGYSFNQAILYRRYNSMPMLPTDASKKITTASLGEAKAYVEVKADTFRLSRQADTLLLHSTRRKQGTNNLLPASSFNNTYYGFSLTNGKPGILYHGIGVNGAMFYNYTDEEYIQRLALLRPQLMIISLGTNETFGRNFTGIDFSVQVHRFLSLLKKVMPDVEIVLTTPPECYRRFYVNKKRVYKRNVNTEKAAAALKQVAKEEGVVCWDLFAATGGANSCRKWFTQDLLGRDRIHFTQRGYNDQGVMLYRALMNAYNQHLKDKKEVSNQDKEN